MNEKYWLFVKQLMNNIKNKECKPCKFVKANKQLVNEKYVEYNSEKIKNINVSKSHKSK